jgi:hypothetical protein
MASSSESQVIGSLRDSPPSKRVKNEIPSPVLSPAPLPSSQALSRPPPPHRSPEFPSQSDIPLGKIKSENRSTIFSPVVAPSPQSPSRPPPTHRPPNPLAPAQPDLPFLPLFIQAALQRKVSVEYPAQFSGPSHCGTWTVKCIGRFLSQICNTATSID